MLVDPKQIRKTANPQDAIEAATGTYKDNTANMSVQDRIDYLPKGPDPKPFVLKNG